MIACQEVVQNSHWDLPARVQHLDLINSKLRAGYCPLMLCIQRHMWALSGLTRAEEFACIQTKDYLFPVAGHPGSIEKEIDAQSSSNASHAKEPTKGDPP